jgi:hypothetical protein
VIRGGEALVLQLPPSLPLAFTFTFLDFLFVAEQHIIGHRLTDKDLPLKVVKAMPLQNRCVVVGSAAIHMCRVTIIARIPFCTDHRQKGWCSTLQWPFTPLVCCLLLFTIQMQQAQCPIRLVSLHSRAPPSLSRRGRCPPPITGTSRPPGRGTS